MAQICIPFQNICKSPSEHFTFRQKSISFCIPEPETLQPVLPLLFLIFIFWNEDLIGNLKLIWQNNLKFKLKVKIEDDDKSSSSEIKSSNHCIIICKHHVLTRFLKNVLGEEGEDDEDGGEGGEEEEG